MKFKQRARAGLLVSITLLFVLSVPWYRSADAPLVLWWGLPDWVAVALGCYLGVAILNAFAWLLTDVVDPELPADRDESQP